MKSQRRVKWSERWDELKDERGWEGATGEYELLLIEDECPWQKAVASKARESQSHLSNLDTV